MGDPVKSIRKAISEFFHGEVEKYDFDVGLTNDLRHGDLTTNVAMVVHSELGGKYSSPRELAGELVEHLESDENTGKLFSKIEVAGPGFVNFWYSDDFLLERLRGLSLSSKFESANSTFKNKKVMVEFTDPNPFKEFHIGHLYSNIVGESVSRILEANGAEVKRVNYQGDVGMHVAKALWGIFEKLKALGDVDEEFKKISEKSLDERVKFLGESYALGAVEFEENEKVKQEIVELNKRIFEKDSSVMAFYEKGKEWSLEYFDEIYKRLGTRFWKLYFESEVGERGRRIVEENLENGIFEKSEGAIIFPGEKHGLHNRVFVNSLGLPTYEAKELGLAPTKYDDYEYDLSIIVTGNEINEYFKVLLKALSFVYPELAEKTRHISHGMVRLPEGKMSSRTGKVVTGESMLDQAVEKAFYRIQEVTKEKFEEDNVYYSKDANVKPPILNAAEPIGVGAVKYALLKQGIGHDVVFDFDEVVNFEGNSGPYLQYSYVRIRSILSKLKGTRSTGSGQESEKLKVKVESEELEKEEKELLRSLMCYPIVISQAGENFSPNTIATYLHELSQYFNSFYQKHKVIGGAREEFRVFLCESFGNVLKNGLGLLGIETVEKM